MAKKRVKRRQQHGSAWHWKQTDSWYYTEPGTRKRVPLFDEKGERVRGKENKEAARLALARVKQTDELQPSTSRSDGKWTIARVCDSYLVDLHRTASADWARQVKGWLNDLCGYCGALDVSEFKRRHLRNWLGRHTNWSDNTKRNVIGSVKAAFNFCVKDGDIDVNPVAGYEKPTQVPRVTAFSPEDEKALYGATDEAFALFIKACILTGARPYSELANVTADHVVESDHGMYYELKGHKTAKKTGKPRRILLTAEMEEITRELVSSSPQGSGRELFRSTRDRAWRRCNASNASVDFVRSSNCRRTAACTPAGTRSPNGRWRATTPAGR